MWLSSGGREEGRAAEVASVRDQLLPPCQAVSSKWLKKGHAAGQKQQ